MPEFASRRRRYADVDTCRGPRLIRAIPPADWIDEVARGRRARLSVALKTHYQPGQNRLSGDPRIAVVVISFNRRDELVANLQRLKSLPEHPAIVVVDNGSEDGTEAAVRSSHPDVELLVLERNIGAAGRNVAVEHIRSRYIAFADDDTWWAPGSLSLAADLLDRHPSIGVVTATIRVEPQGIEDPVVTDMRVSHLPDEPGLPGYPLLSILAGASVVRRNAFQTVGGFEPRFFIGGEEELFSADLAAAGWALRHIPEMTVHHESSLQRDSHLRRAQGLRNTLWFCWLRRPFADAVKRSWRTLRGSQHDRVTARALLQALHAMPWVLRERRRLPDSVANGLRLLDDQQLTSNARQYIS